MSLACGCDDDGYADLYNSVMRKARKAHRCRECGRTIQPGEIYEYETWMFDGDFNSKKSCEKCGDLAHSLIDLGFCWPSGDLAIAYKEYLDEYTKCVKYDEENDRYIYPANHLIDAEGNQRRITCSS